MFIPFWNALPLHVWILLSLAVLGLCNYLKALYGWRAKIEMFSNYRGVLVEFHNKVKEGKGIDPELSDYLLENALKINLDSIVHIRNVQPMLGISTGIINVINDIVMLQCYNLTETCRNFDNMLIQNIGAFKEAHQKTLSKIINPISLVKNGVYLIFNIIPIVNLTPRKIKDFLSNLFAFVVIVNTLSSLFLKKELLLSTIRQIITWISQNVLN